MTSNETFEVEPHVYWKKVFGLDAPSAIVARHGLEDYERSEEQRRQEKD